MIYSRSRIGKLYFLTIGIALSAESALFAKDFWQERPFSAWNEREARRILSDSPWGKIQNVAMLQDERAQDQPKTQVGGIPSSPPPSATTAGREGAAVDARGDSSMGRGGPDAGSPDGMVSEPRNATRSVSFQIVWYSSIVVREAMGRLAQLHGGISSEQVNSFIQQPVDNYIVAVSGPMLNLLEQANLESLKPKTFLISKKDKNKKLELKEYDSPKDRKDGLALFVFPRTIDGKPALDMADDEVQFVTELPDPNINITTSFKLSKMVKDGKLDI
jgi:hypothetical protein